MTRYTGAEVLVNSLENEGVEYIFGIPGEQTIPLMDVLRSSTIEFVVTRHEQGAAFMADVYSRISGNTGVCLATLGPGATNLVTGVGNASLDHSSVVALTSQRKTTDQHKHAHQFIDTNSIFEDITKFTDQVIRPETIPEQVRKAFAMASRERQGATHLALPRDVTTAETDATPLEISGGESSPNGVQTINVESAMDILSGGDQQVIIAGQGVLSQNASAELTRFAEQTGVPVVTTFMGKGGISSRHQKSVGTIGFSSDDYAIAPVEKADTVFTIGYDYIEFHPESWNLGREKEIVHIDVVEPEIDEHYDVDLTLIGNVRRILEQLNNKAYRVADDAYAQRVGGRVDKQLQEEYVEHDTAPFTPQQTIKCLRQAVADDSIVLSDVGAHKYWMSRRYPAYEPNSFVVSNGFASMGVALPGALAADLCTDKDVVAVNGDGGFMMNLQELETAKRLGLDATIIVLDDTEYTAITMEQNNEYKSNYGSTFENPDIPALAESFGANGYEVTDASQMQSTIEEAVTTGGPSVVNVPIDEQESYKLEAQM